MKVILISENHWSSTLTVAISDLKGAPGNDVELSNCNPEDLFIDNRPMGCDKEGYKFDVTIEGDEITVTRTDDKGGWGEITEVWGSWHNPLCLRMYNKSEEEVPEFGSFYTFLGVPGEMAPYDAIEAYVDPSVKTIQKGAFFNNEKMKKCVMEDTVERIEKYAFSFCESLKTLRISQILKHIRERAFNECGSLRIIVIPNTVMDIDPQAFRDCANVKILALPSSINLDNVPDDIIDNCPKLHQALPHNMEPKQWLQQRFLNLPLHQTCYNINLTTQDILQCIRLHPHSTTQQDSAGMTALHIVSMLAWAGHCNMQVVFCTLYEANPVSLFIRDIYGSTPLDYLQEQEGMMGLIINLMQDLCPNRVKEEDVKHGQKKKKDDNE